jgi:hypothetical protein
MHVPRAAASASRLALQAEVRNASLTVLHLRQRCSYSSDFSGSNSLALLMAQPGASSTVLEFTCTHVSPPLRSRFSEHTPYTPLTNFLVDTRANQRRTTLNGTLAPRFLPSSHHSLQPTPLLVSRALLYAAACACSRRSRWTHKACAV